MSLSISLQLEATGYPGLDMMIKKSGISSSLYSKHPEKHMTLSIIIVQVQEILKKLYKINPKFKKIFGDRKLNSHDINLIEDILSKAMCEVTSQFVLKEIKPMVDKMKAISLEFSDLDLWPSGHFVAAFYDDPDNGWDKMVKKTRTFLKKVFPTGRFMIPEDEVVPHLTLAKYERSDRKDLKKRLKQPTWDVKDYRIITKQWIIYPSIRLYR